MSSDEFSQHDKRDSGNLADKCDAIISSRRHQATLIQYLFVGLVFALVGFLLAPKGLKLMDMPEFYAPGRMLLENTQSFLYDPSFLMSFEQKLFADYQAPILYIPPFALALLIPLGLLPAAIANYVWFVVLIVCSVGSLAILRKLIGMSERVFLWFSTLVSVSGPGYEAIKHGQLAPVLLLSLCGSLLFASRRQDLLAGLCLGFLIAKPHLLLPLVAFYIGARRFRLLLGLAGATLIITTASWLLFGSSVFNSYIHLLSLTEQNRIWMASEAGPTLHGQLLRFLPQTPIIADKISLAVMTLTLLTLFLLGDRVRRSLFWWQYAALAGVPLALVTAWHCHTYDLLLLVPSVAIFLYGAVASKLSPWRKCLWLSPLVIYMMPLYAKVHYEYVLHGAILNPLFLVSIFLALAATTWLWLISGDIQAVSAKMNSELTSPLS